MIFSFLEIFFFLGWYFFLAFAIGFKFTGGRRRHGEKPAGLRSALRASLRPPLRPSGLAGSSPCRRRTPVNLKAMAKVNKKKYSAKKKKYSPTNENTHPTETPICLWYCLFLLTRSFYLTFYYFLLLYCRSKSNYKKISFDDRGILSNRNFILLNNSVY